MKRKARGLSYQKPLLKNQASSLILHETIETTLAKAKDLRPYLEKLITVAKKETLAARRMLVATLGSEVVASKMMEVIGPAFKDRKGGYLRIIKLAPRGGDNTPMSKVEFVVKPTETVAKTKVEKPTKGKVAEKTKEIKKKILKEP